MTTDTEVPKNGQSGPAATTAAEPETVNISRMRSGDLDEALWHGRRARERLQMQLSEAKHRA